ncbi:hypothetical protein [Sphingomonas baiyangensis]|uniref:Uncharacterized protein n=1 Tax=Sphingomonas baiyangensis TaxID=2572576 RepID=A0A4U1L634_9SPHN|nr:hypothetical protein [Sphingomonas baiyangensis]TKD52054.1 hypothetical protein FBR43_15920 [Sphingomonas baiyangensis]
MDVKSHALAAFEDARIAIRNDVGGIIADHAQRGLLRSGATFKRAIASYETQTALFMDECLSRISTHVNGRGRRWNEYTSQARIALQVHLNAARAILQRAIEVSGVSDGSIEREIGRANKKILQKFDDYASGWTAPRSIPWTERHKFFFSFTLIVIGAIISKAIELVHKFFFPSY